MNILKSKFCWALFSVIVMGLFSTGAHAGTVNITVSSTDNGATNPYTWGVNAPDQYTNYAGSTNFENAISNAGIKIVRVNIIPKCKQDGEDPYPSANTWNFTDVDSILTTIFNAGAVPIFQVVGFPAGVSHTLDGSNNITSADWNAYATFMNGVVTRYNVNKVLGSTRTIKYWEMWNEPTDESNGIFTSQANYGTFVSTVGAAMHSADSTIQLIGPVDAWANLASGGYLNYTAKNLSSQIGMLCWHNYGPGSGNTDQQRLNWTQQAYQLDPLNVESGDGGLFTSPSGATFPTALTEYNICSYSFGDDAEFSNQIGSTYTGSAVINAMLGNVGIFTYFTTAQAGGNILGLLNDTSFAVQSKAYYVLQLFGTHFGNGDRKLSTTGTSEPVECAAGYSSTTGHRFIAIANKDVSNSQTYNFTVNGVNASGTVNAWLVDASNNGTYSASTYSSNSFSYTVGPESFVVFEVIPGGSANVHSGTWSCKAVVTSSPTYANISQVVSCASSTNYVGSIWIKGSGAVELDVKNGSWGSDLATVRCNATGSWQKISTSSFNTGSNTQLTFILQDQYGSAGTCYIDDCALGVSGGTNLLTNPGFESGNTGWGTVSSPFGIGQF